VLLVAVLVLLAVAVLVLLAVLVLVLLAVLLGPMVLAMVLVRGRGSRGAVGRSGCCRQ
jgi:hypothetical protein